MEGGSGDTKLWFIYDLAEKESCVRGGRCICEVDLEGWSWLSNYSMRLFGFGGEWTFQWALQVC